MQQLEILEEIDYKVARYGTNIQHVTRSLMIVREHGKSTPDLPSVLEGRCVSGVDQSRNNRLPLSTPTTTSTVHIF